MTNETTNETIEWTDAYGQVFHLQHRPGDEVTWDMPTTSGVHYTATVEVTGFDLNDEVTPYEVTVLELVDTYEPDEADGSGARTYVGDRCMATAFDMGDYPIEQKGNR